MSATIRYERNAIMSAAHLSHEDGGQAHVFCAIPGGTPWLQMRSYGGPRVTITNAPQCETHREFVAFVSERFGS